MRYTLLNKVAQICGRDSGVHTAGVRRARQNGGVKKYSCKADKRAFRSEYSGMQRRVTRYAGGGVRIFFKSATAVQKNDTQKSYSI